MGTILSATNTFVEGTGNLTGGTYVVELDSTDELLLTGSARIQNMVGEEVTLICTRQWEPRTRDYWYCLLGGELGD